MTKKHKQIDEHLYTLMHSMNSACQLVEMLPQGDITEELSTMLEIQYDILSHFLTDRHYGSDQLEDFVEFSSNVIKQIDQLKSK